jgi:predicted negative regulator of RcsB-dependent stress response
MADYELNDHDRAELVKNFFKRFGYWVILAIIVVAIGLTVNAYWQSHQNTRAQAASNAYQALIISMQNGAKPDVIRTAATQISTDYPGTVYASLAELNLAQLALKQNDLATAATILKKALDQNENNRLAPIISLRLARVLLAQNEAKAALKVLKDAPKGYVSAYGLLTGDAYIQLNDKAAALKSYEAALANVNNPLMGQLLTERINNLSAT